VRDGGNLVELRCSSNPIVNLFLAASPHLKSFDCFGINLMVPISPSTTSHISSTETVYINNPALLGSTISLGVYSGISTLG
jgi:hypothetical protein